MQIKRLLDDRVVVTGDRLINSEGEHCEFVECANGQLVALPGLPGYTHCFSTPWGLCYLLVRPWAPSQLAYPHLPSLLA
jgi:hypothetical protein